MAEAVLPRPPSAAATFPDKPSLVAPHPLKSVVSDPLDEFGDLQLIWDELVTCLLVPAKMSNSKGTSITPGRENEFIVSTVFDGAKFNQPHDFVCAVKYRLSRGQSLIYCEMLKGPATVGHRLWLIAHTEPLRLEMWGETPDLNRASGMMEKAILQLTLDAMLYRLSTQVKVNPNVDSPSCSGMKSCVSDVLDKLFSANDLWDALVNYFKQPTKDGVLKDYATKSSDSDGCVMEMEFDTHALERTFAASKGKVKALSFTLQVEVTFDKDKKTVVSHASGLSKKYYVVLENPLRVEAWCDLQDGTRKCDKEQAAGVQAILNRIVRHVHGVPPVHAPTWGDSPSPFTFPVGAGRGPASSISVLCEVPSPSAPGYKSVLTSEFPFQQVDLLGRLVKVLKDPPTGTIVKTSQLQDSSPDSFTTLCTVSLGPQPFKTIVTHKIIWDKCCIVADEKFEHSGTLMMRRILVVHKNPTKIECWGEVADGTRRAGDLLRQLVESYVPQLFEAQK